MAPERDKCNAQRSSRAELRDAQGRNWIQPADEREQGSIESVCSLPFGEWKTLDYYCVGTMSSSVGESTGALPAFGP